MKRCKDCKEVISWDFADLMSGEKEIPKAVKKESIIQGRCSECYDRRVYIGVKQS